LKKTKTIITENVDAITVILIIAGLLLALYLVGFKLTDEEKTTINILSVIGTIASSFGLAIALIQIIALKEISVITQSTIQDTKEKLMLGISISDVTESIKLISEIDSFIGNQKYEIARLKIVDLREKLIQFKSSKEFQLIVEDNKIQEIIGMLNTQISTIYNVIFSEEEIKYNPEEITNQLQEIATHLTDFRNKIKYQTV
jgi:lysylphosphatidylglycerol synthetase-like protein (DUF2156 family)